MDAIEVFEKANNLSFNDKELLKTVFVHRSYLNEHKDFVKSHNERLEFLGDAVLELVVTDYLYNNFPNPEGDLTSWRSALVKGSHLAEIAEEIGMPDALLLSKGEDKSGGRAKGYLLANALEALFGAIYLDQGYDVVSKLIHLRIIPRLENIIKDGSFIDPKTKLQELIQANEGITPTYRILSESGPDHLKEFIAEVLVGEKVLATGIGNTKQGAHKAAAENALLELETPE